MYVSQWASDTQDLEASSVTGADLFAPSMKTAEMAPISIGSPKGVPVPCIWSLATISGGASADVSAFLSTSC